MFSVIFLNLLLAGVTDIASPSLKACSHPPSSSIVYDLSKLPKSIKDRINKILPDLAERNSAFQRDDQVINNLPKRRFVGAVSSNNRYVFVYEHGVVDHMHAITFSIKEYGRGGDKSYTMIPNGNLVGPLCPIVQASLLDVRAADPGHF